LFNYGQNDNIHCFDVSHLGFQDSRHWLEQRKQSHVIFLSRKYWYYTPKSYLYLKYW